MEFLLGQLRHQTDLEVLPTLIERRADDHWPRATININSEPSSARPARSNLYLHLLNVPSDLAGKFGETDVQQQRKIVRTQVDKILHVPRPSGSLTQPRAVGMVSFMFDIHLNNVHDQYDHGSRET